MKLIITLMVLFTSYNSYAFFSCDSDCKARKELKRKQKAAEKENSESLVSKVIGKCYRDKNKVTTPGGRTIVCESEIAYCIFRSYGDGGEAATCVPKAK